MVLELTTLARIQTRLGIELGDDDSPESLWIETAIAAMSQRVERYIDRPLLVAARTELHDVPRAHPQAITLRAYPVTSITSIKSSALWAFSTATALTSTDYTFEAANGLIHFRATLEVGPQALQVVYTAGMVADTDAAIANYPELVEACELQVYALFRRRSSPQGVTFSEGGSSVTSEGQLALVKEVEAILKSYRRVRFG